MRNAQYEQNSDSKNSPFQYCARANRWHPLRGSLDTRSCPGPAAPDPTRLVVRRFCYFLPFVLMLRALVECDDPDEMDRWACGVRDSRLGVDSEAARDAAGNKRAEEQEDSDDSVILLSDVDKDGCQEDVLAISSSDESDDATSSDRKDDVSRRQAAQEASSRSIEGSRSLTRALAAARSRARSSSPSYSNSDSNSEATLPSNPNKLRFRPNQGASLRKSEADARREKDARSRLEKCMREQELLARARYRAIGRASVVFVYVNPPARAPHP